MYEREKTVVLKSSASLLSNNVSRVTVNGQTYTGIIHKDELNIVRPAAPEVEHRVVAAKVTYSGQGNITIMQAAWVEVSNRILLVLATTQGALFYDWDGSLLLYAHLLPPVSTNAAALSFTRGVAGLDSGCVAVGVHTGEVVLVSVEEDDIKTVEVARWRTRPITALASQGLLLATGDDEGHITMAKDEDGLKAICSIDTYGAAVTCLGMWEGRLVAGYLSGHIRIFYATDGRIIAEICAHARNLTGLDIAREAGLILTTSEDSFIRIWQLNSNDSACPVEHKYSSIEENTALCGGVFTNQLGGRFVTAGYDRRELVCYAR